MRIQNQYGYATVEYKGIFMVADTYPEAFAKLFARLTLLGLGI